MASPLNRILNSVIVAAIAAVLLMPVVSQPAAAFDHFISRSGSNLFDGDKPYRFVSVNIPNYFILEDRAGEQGHKWHRVSAFEQRDAVAAVRRMGGQLFRSYTFSVEGGKNLAGNLAHIYADERGRIRYNEELFRDVDRGLAIAREAGVRVIIPLVDNWAWFGGFAEWAALSGADDFWRDRKAKNEFRKFIHWLLNRTNTVTGIRYRDDPTIMAWELGNEIDKATPEWIGEMAAEIRNQDGNHLIIDGGHKHIPEVALSDPNIDIVTTHYTDADFSDFAAAAAGAGKAYFYGEFNPSELDTVREIVRRTIDSRAAGCLAWSLRFRTEHGGFYFHSDFNGSSDSLHYPGFAATLPKQESNIIAALREGAHAIRGLPLPPEAVPETPTLLPIESPTSISWQGSAGAISYILQRKKGEDGEWKTVASDISDAIAVEFYGDKVARLPLYSDNPGAGSWHYRVIARNGSGESPPSNIVTLRSEQ